MSGGSLSYFYLHLQEHVGDFGDKELDDLVSDLADLFHAREWYLSSDASKDDWREARDKFKKKWFTEQGHKERIEKYLSEFTSEIKETFGIDTQPSAQAETAKRIVGKSRGGMTMWYQCDMCNEPVDEKDIFCSGCGRRFVNE